MLLVACVSLTATVASNNSTTSSEEGIELNASHLDIVQDMQEDVHESSLVQCTISYNITVNSPDGSSTTASGSVSASTCKEAVQAVKEIKEAMM